MRKEGSTLVAIGYRVYPPPCVLNVSNGNGQAARNVLPHRLKCGVQPLALSRRFGLLGQQCSFNMAEKGKNQSSAASSRYFFGLAWTTSDLETSSTLCHILSQPCLTHTLSGAPSHKSTHPFTRTPPPSLTHTRFDSPVLTHTRTNDGFPCSWLEAAG